MKWRLSARIADDLECRIEILKYPQCDNPTHIKLSWVDRERKQLRFVLEHNSDEPANDLPPDDLPF